MSKFIIRLWIFVIFGLLISLYISMRLISLAYQIDESNLKIHAVQTLQVEDRMRFSTFSDMYYALQRNQAIAFAYSDSAADKHISLSDKKKINEIDAWEVGYWYPDEDTEFIWPVMYGSTGHELDRIPPSLITKRSVGDAVFVWYQKDFAEGENIILLPVLRVPAMYWNPESGLALGIRHSNGIDEPPDDRAIKR